MPRLNNTGCAILIILAFLGFALMLAELITGAIFLDDGCNSPQSYLLVQGASQTGAIIIGFVLIVFIGAYSSCASYTFQILYYINLIFQLVWNIVYMVRTFSDDYEYQCLESKNGSQFYEWFHVAVIINIIYTSGLVVGSVFMCFENNH